MVSFLVPVKLSIHILRSASPYRASRLMNAASCFRALRSRHGTPQTTLGRHQWRTVSYERDPYACCRGRHTYVTLLRLQGVREVGGEQTCIQVALLEYQDGAPYTRYMHVELALVPIILKPR